MKKATIFFVAILLKAVLVYGIFIPGGSKVGIGSMPSQVTDTSELHPTAADRGARVTQLKDSQDYRWSGSNWLNVYWMLYKRTEADAVFVKKDSIGALVYTKSQSDARYLQSEVDGSVTNELQTISGSGTTITLSNGGGSYAVPVPTTTSQLTNNSGFITAASIAPSFNNAPARSLNSSFQISTTKNTRVSYSVTHTITLAIIGGIISGSSMAYLEISPNNSTWSEISRAGYSDGVSIAINLTKTTSNNVQGEVPAGYWTRIRTATSGGGAAAINSGQEVQY